MSKKRIVSLITVFVIMVMIFAPVTMAKDGLKIVDISPKNGDTGQQMENMSVKLYFNKNVYSKENLSVNEKAIKLVNASGDVLPTRLLVSSKDKKVAIVITTVTPGTKEYNKVIKPKTKYTLTIDKNFVSSNGDTLEADYVTSYETLDPLKTQMISFGMIALVVVVMIFSSKKMLKNQMEEEKKGKEEKVNPYKVAKETGKSVEKIVAEEKKKKEKAARKAVEKAAMLEELDKDLEEDSDKTYKVKFKKPIASYGSSFGLKKKEEAAERLRKLEEKKKREEQWAKKAKVKSKSKARRKKK